MLSEIEKQCKTNMIKALDYLHEELKGVRTGRAAPGLVDHLKVTVQSYGSTMDLRELAAITAPESALLMIKPFDPGVTKDIEKAIQASNLGLTPMVDGSNIRLPIPPLSGERRQQLIQEIKKMAEAQKVVVRNARRDANKHIDHEKKEKTVSEDEADESKENVNKLTKSFENKIDDALNAKQVELEKV